MENWLPIRYSKQSHFIFMTDAPNSGVFESLEVGGGVGRIFGRNFFFQNLFIDIFKRAEINILKSGP